MSWECFLGVAKETSEGSGCAFMKPSLGKPHLEKGDASNSIVNRLWLSVCWQTDDTAFFRAEGVRWALAGGMSPLGNCGADS